MKPYLVVLIAITLATSNASACSFPQYSLEQDISRAEEIFIATLLEARVMPKDEHHQWPWIEGRFRVAKTLKGNVQPKDVRLSTGMGRGDCGVAMLVSSKYIIFKGARDAGIGIDSGSQAIEDFQEEEMVTKIQSLMRSQKTQSPNEVAHLY